MSEELVGRDVPGPDPAAPNLAASDLAARINAMIAAHFDLDIGRLTPETEVATLGIDSLGMIEFLFEMEDKLGVKMPESRVPPATVQQVIDEIGRALRAQNKDT